MCVCVRERERGGEEGVRERDREREKEKERERGRKREGEGESIISPWLLHQFTRLIHVSRTYLYKIFHCNRSIRNITKCVGTRGKPRQGKMTSVMGLSTKLSELCYLIVVSFFEKPL